jgi:hypothetical protein
MRRVAVVVVLLALCSSGCAVHDLAFENDHRLEFVTPKSRETVDLPVTIRWRAPEIRAQAGAGPYFAVFIDREPIRPGQSLRAVGDAVCKRTPGCPDAAYLRDRFVFVTSQHSLTLTALPARGGTRTGGRDTHQAVVVLVDGKGNRTGEAAFRREFVVDNAEEHT